MVRPGQVNVDNRSWRLLPCLRGRNTPSPSFGPSINCSAEMIKYHGLWYSSGSYNMCEIISKALTSWFRKVRLCSSHLTDSWGYEILHPATRKLGSRCLSRCRSKLSSCLARRDAIQILGLLCSSDFALSHWDNVCVRINKNMYLF